MSSQDSPNVGELAHRCAEEMVRYRREGWYDPQYCYELFRCALVQRREEAWAAIYEQYHRLVYHWLGHTSEDSDILVNHVFDRFWRALTPERFPDFDSVKALLGYLKRCAQGVAIDARRKEERREARNAALVQMERAAARRVSDLSKVLDDIVSEQLYAHVTQALRGKEERLVFRATFEWEMKPAQIAARWPNTFDDARHVSRIKERILRRLRCDKGLLELLGMRDVDDPPEER